MDKFDKYENEVLKSYEDDEWESIDNLDEKKEEYAQYARNTFLKNKRVGIAVMPNLFPNGRF